MKTLNSNPNCDCVCSCPPEFTPTPAERRGYIVGVSLFQLNQDERQGARMLNKGDVVVLCNDDGTNIPEFQAVSEYTKDPKSWMRDTTTCSFGAFDQHVTFIGNHELEPQEIQDCECRCTCTPAELDGWVEGKTIFKVTSDHMSEYGIRIGDLVVMNMDDGSEYQRFQRLQNFLNKPSTHCSFDECTCYLHKSHLEETGHELS